MISIGNLQLFHRTTIRKSADESSVVTKRRRAGALQSFFADVSKHSTPVISYTNDGPVFGPGCVDQFLCARGVRDVAIVIIVIDHYAVRRTRRMGGELQHLNVAISVARSKNRAASGSAPNAHSLCWSIIE